MQLPSPEVMHSIQSVTAAKSSNCVHDACTLKRCSPPVIPPLLLAYALCRDALNRQLHPATRTFQALRIAVNNEVGGGDCVCVWCVRVCVCVCACVWCVCVCVHVCGVCVCVWCVRVCVRVCGVCVCACMRACVSVVLFCLNTQSTIMFW